LRHLKLSPRLRMKRPAQKEKRPVNLLECSQCLFAALELSGKRVSQPLTTDEDFGLLEWHESLDCDVQVLGRPGVKDYELTALRSQLLRSFDKIPASNIFQRNQPSPPPASVLRTSEDARLRDRVLWVMGIEALRNRNAVNVLHAVNRFSPSLRDRRSNESQRGAYRVHDSPYLNSEIPPKRAIHLFENEISTPRESVLRRRKGSPVCLLSAYSAALGVMYENPFADVGWHTATRLDENNNGFPRFDEFDSGIARPGQVVRDDGNSWSGGITLPASFH